jgi:hypothetical protein
MSNESHDDPKLLSPDQPPELPVFYDGRQVGTAYNHGTHGYSIRMHEPELRKHLQSSFRQLLIDQNGVAFGIEISPGSAPKSD